MPTNYARPSDGLLPVAQTLALLSLVRDRPNGTEEAQAIRDLAAMVPTSWSRARNTIAKLIQYGLLATDGERIEASHDADDELPSQVAGQIVIDLVTKLNQTDAWGCVHLDAETQAVTLDGMSLPLMSDGLGMWIIEFGVASREQTESRHWEVGTRYVDAFISGVRTKNAKSPRRARSAEELARQLAAQAENGRLAEEWVLKYERDRLHGHAFVDQVRRVSEVDVAAGYDIASFANLTSLRHDLFIEVKSYGAIKLFHWSRNEIATAKEFGEEYALYLVDRTQMDNAGYTPHAISAPTPEIFARPESGWKVEATSYEHVAMQQGEESAPT